MKKHKRILLIALFMISLFAMPVTAHAGWKTVTTKAKRFGNYTIWRESEGGFAQDMYVRNRKTGRTVTIKIAYTSRAVSNGKIMYYSEIKDKYSGVYFHKYNLATGKDTFLKNIPDGYNLVAYRNGYIYYNSRSDTLKKYRISTKKSKAVKKNFRAETWNGKRTITGYKPNQYDIKVRITI